MGYTVDTGTAERVVLARRWGTAMQSDGGRHRRDDPPGFEHVALLHAGDTEFVDAAAGHARVGFERDEPVIAALSPRHLDLLRGALGSDAHRVDYRDMSEIGRNPGRLIPAMHDVLRQYHGRGRLHIVGGSVWPERSTGEQAAAMQNEALLNLAVPDAAVSLLCPYDVAGLDRTTVELAAATHPVVREGGRSAVASPTYHPAKAAEAAIGDLDTPDDFGQALIYDAPDGPRTVRRAVAEHALENGLDADRTGDLCLAAHELAVNTAMHTGAPGLLTLWVDDEGVSCEIQDSGWIRDPLAGRYPAGPGDGRGYGLHLVHQLCDLVRIRSGPEGTTVRLSMRRS